MHNLFLVYFVNLYMFQAYLGPSSGGTNARLQQFVLIVLFRSLSVVLVGLEQLEIQLLHTKSVTVNHLQDTKICICSGALQRTTFLQRIIKTD